MTDTPAWITALEAQFDENEGFLGLLRAGHFDTLARDAFLRLLRSIHVDPAAPLDRQLVSILWYLPLLLRWQEDRLDGDDLSSLMAVEDTVVNELERILGVP